MVHWLKPAVKFARKHRAALACRPVWLFSSGPLGTDLVDKDGNDVPQATRPKEFDELTELLRPRGEQIFFGALRPGRQTQRPGRTHRQAHAGDSGHHAHR